MPSLRKPTPDAIAAFVASQANLAFSYPEVGETAGQPPSGYSVDRTRVKLGEGEQVFAAAQRALERWEHFRLGWVEACCRPASIRAGGTVAVVARCLGVWWLNACRIVYVVDEDGPVKHFGFAYGTLPGHAETGEERFVVEWDRSGGGVYYDILAFSRPHGVLSRLGYVWLRRVQKRFARDSASAMINTVKQSGR